MVKRFVYGKFRTLRFYLGNWLYMTMITGTREIGRRVAIPASAVGSSTDMGLPIYTCFDLAKNKKEPETEINLYK
jgi:hypothetical protein